MTSTLLPNKGHFWNCEIVKLSMTSTAPVTDDTSDEPEVPKRSLLRRKSSAAADWMIASFNSAKASTTNKIEKRLTMEGLLKQAHISLKHFLDPKLLSFEEKFFRNLLKSAQGIVFVTELKGGFFLGVKGGSGIILARTDSNAHINIPTIAKIQHSDVKMQWSAPCAVGTGGISFGFQGGATKVDHIIILSTEDHIDVFMGKGQLQLGGSASAVVAKYGRNANVGMTVGPGVADKSPGNIAPMVSYSFGVKGLFGGVSLEMEILKPRLKCNEQFYDSSEITTEDILKGRNTNGLENKNEDYIAIVNLLNTYVTGPEIGTYPNFAPPSMDDEIESKNDDMNLEENDAINSQSMQMAGEGN